MTSTAFVIALAGLLSAIFYWGFRHLPSEEWQMLASVPTRKERDGQWRGVNLTYYGFFNATACAFACAMTVLLMSAVNTPWTTTFIVIVLLLAIALPAARIVARVVERKKHTFTVGGASFICIVVLPWLLTACNSALHVFGFDPIPMLPMLAAVAIAYAFGEAVGRLACISFGCCYGQSLGALSPRWLERYRKFCFVFTGATKKAAYESNLSGVPVVPIQAITCTIFGLAGLAGTLFFFTSHWLTAIIVPVAATQIWRVLSEFLRADFRGGNRISAYQVMALLALVYSLLLVPFIEPGVIPKPTLAAAFHSFSSGWLVILIEAVWIAVFIYLGRSSVTSSRLSFHVVRERI